MSRPKLPKSVKFTVPPKSSGKKYVATLPDGKKVRFGSSSYEQYKDSVPKAQGGGKWSHKDHLDKKRRDSYRKRHGAVRCKDGRLAYKVKYSPSWFSYWFLW